MTDSDSTDETWLDAFRRTWYGLEDEGRDPARTVSDWGGRKESTARAWKRGRCEPNDTCKRQLAKKACREGYPFLSRLYVPGTHRLEKRGRKTEINGGIEDNVVDLVRVSADIHEAYRQGNVRRLHALADRGEKEMDEVRGEAKRLMEVRGDGAPTGTTTER